MGRKAMVIETRYCSEDGKEISKLDKTGKPLTASNYNRKITCPGLCARKRRNRIIKIKQGRHMDVYDYFILGHQHLLRKVA